MKIYKILERWGNQYRLQVKATENMNKCWLDIVNDGYSEDEKYKSFEEAMNDPHQCYLSNDKGYLVMEVIVDLDKDTYYTEYYFDDYEYIAADLTDEELKEIDDFIEKNKHKVKDKKLKWK